MIETLSNLRQAFLSAGCRSILIKRMAPNDNSKNQIYLGGDFTALNLLPFSVVKTDSSELGGSLRDRLKAIIKFAWLNEEELIYNSVNLILYPKYPEVRLSGVLKHRTASKEISKLISSRDEGRLLFLGVCKRGGVVGYCSGRDDQLTKEFQESDNVLAYPRQGIFAELSIGSEDKNPVSIITNALSPIIDRGWIESFRLNRFGDPVSCKAANCGGYTLEASLGIIPNGISEPDFEGWEVKQYGVTKFESKASKAITLMTPEPDGGFYKSVGVVPFLEKYGYPDKNNPIDRRNFGGVHKVGLTHKSTELRLELNGYDLSQPSKWDPRGEIQLRNDREIAASWSFSGLLKHWQRKHAKAVYVRSMMRLNPDREYRYGSNVQLGLGTDFTHLLKALACGGVFYDPGIKMEGVESGKIKSKRRSQFRVKSGDVRMLYKTFETQDLGS